MRHFRDKPQQRRDVGIDQQPLHGLMCRRQRCAGRVMRRHDEMVDLLARMLKNNVDGLTVDKEPPVREDRELRADLKIQIEGRMWYVDVQITCPATYTQVMQRRTHEVQGAAADVAYQRKLNKYSAALEPRRGRRGRVLSVRDFQPFIIETGGFIHHQSAAWLDDLLGAKPATTKRVYSAIGMELDRHHGKMLSNFKSTVI